VESLSCILSVLFRSIWPAVSVAGSQKLERVYLKSLRVYLEYLERGFDYI